MKRSGKVVEKVILSVTSFSTTGLVVVRDDVVIWGGISMEPCTDLYRLGCGNIKFWD